MIQANLAARFGLRGDGVLRAPMPAPLRPSQRQRFRAMARFCQSCASKESRRIPQSEFLLCFAETGYLCEQRAAELLREFAPAERHRLAAAWVEIWVTPEAGTPHWKFWDIIPLRGPTAVPGRRRSHANAPRIGASDARKGTA